MFLLPNIGEQLVNKRDTQRAGQFGLIVYQSAAGLS